MSNVTFTEKKLRDYLLGISGPEDTERFDELSFTSDEFAGLLEAAEHDLADAYVNGELSSEERKNYEERYLGSASGRSKVQFAEVFQAFASESIAAEERIPEKEIRETGIRDTFDGFIRYLKWALAAAAAAVVVFVGWVFFSSNWKGDDLAANTNVPAPNAPVNSERQEQAAGNSIGSNSQSGDLAAVGNNTLPDQDRSVPQQPTRNSKKVDERRSPAPRVFAFSLLPQMRSSTQTPAISIPRDAERISVRLELEPTDFRTYQIDLFDRSGRRVWRSAPVRPSTSNGGRMITANIPSRLLTAGQYRFSVSGIAPSQPPENVGDYAFRITQ